MRTAVDEAITRRARSTYSTRRARAQQQRTQVLCSVARVLERARARVISGIQPSGWARWRVRARA